MVKEIIGRVKKTHLALIKSQMHGRTVNSEDIEYRKIGAAGGGLKLPINIQSLSGRHFS